MLSSICELLSSTVSPWLARSATFSRVASVFPLRHLLGAIMVWFLYVQYHSLPKSFKWPIVTGY